VVVGVDAPVLAERLATVGGAVEGDAQDVEAVGVLGVDAYLAEVERPRDEVVDLDPGVPTVVGAEDAARLRVGIGPGRLAGQLLRVGAGRLDHGEHHLGVAVEDGDAGAAELGRGQPARQLHPRLAAVGAAVQPGLRPELGARVAAGEGAAAYLVGGGEEDVGGGRVAGQVDAAGVGVEGEDVLPRLAAVGGAEDAALLVGAPHAAQRGDEDDVGLFGVDEDLADVLRLAEAF